MNRPALGAMIEQMDSAVGRLLAALAKSGRTRDTLVVFTADHGPLGPSAERKPLRGAKADLYEAGLRVPWLFRWPDRIKPRQVRNLLVSGVDLFPTLLAAAGADATGEIDGINLWPWIEDASRPAARTELCWHYPHYHHLGLGPAGAIQLGDFKLIEWFERVLRPSVPRPDRPAYELFNLTSDPAELHNLADTQPDRRDALRRRLEEWRHAVGAQPMLVNRAYDPSKPTRFLPQAGDLATPEP